jgi:hypothetical protein
VGGGGKLFVRRRNVVYMASAAQVKTHRRKSERRIEGALAKVTLYVAINDVTGRMVEVKVKSSNPLRIAARRSRQSCEKSET